MVPLCHRGCQLCFRPGPCECKRRPRIVLETGPRQFHVPPLSKGPRLECHAPLRALLCAALAAATGALAQSEDSLPAGIEMRTYTGWDKSVFLNATERAVQAVIVPAVGGRVVHFSLDGEISVRERRLARQAVDPRRGTAFGWAATNAIWGRTCAVCPPIPTGPRPESMHIEGRFFRPRLQPGGLADGPCPGKGLSSWRRTPGIWASCKDPQPIGPRGVLLPLGPHVLQGRRVCFFSAQQKEPFPGRLVRAPDREWEEVYDGEHPDSFQAQVVDGMLVVRAVGDMTRIGADSPGGWIAYTRGKLLFVKYFPWFARGNYSDGGNSVEVYFDQRCVELSPLSPEEKLAPGHDYVFPEKWVLIRLDKEAATPGRRANWRARFRPRPLAPCSKCRTGCSSRGCDCSLLNRRFCGRLGT